MEESELGQTGIHIKETPGPESSATSEWIQPEPNPDEMIVHERLSAEIEHFCNLSMEMTGFLTRLQEEAGKSVEQLKQIYSAVDLKKNELKTLLGFEASADALQRLSLDYRQQKENFERMILEQRTFWEKEKSKRTQEEREYQENLQIRRQHEEEEYQQVWAAGKLKLQQKLEEELQIIQQETLSKQRALELEYRDREFALKQKELEWAQLIQELEQFMAKLTMRVRASTGSEPEA